MKWIVISIVLFVGGYTLVNVYYRKPGRGYRPYQDAQDRATTVRLLSAGWHKLAVNTRRPAENPAIGISAATHRDYLGVGPDLETKFAEKPALLATIDQVTAPDSIAGGSEYAIYFTASMDDLKDQLGDLSLYHRDHELVLIPSLETLPGKELMSRRNDSSYWAGFSTAGLSPGTYEMRIVAKGPALAWSFTVR